MQQEYDKDTVDDKYINYHKYDVVEFSRSIKGVGSVAVVAHEFGLFQGHGGIASYLYNIVQFLLSLKNIKVYVLALNLEIEECLENDKNFQYVKLCGDLDAQRYQILNFLKTIEPDYVEFSDYLGLGLYTVIEKKRGKYFSNSILVTNNHTASRECWEWSNGELIYNADMYYYNLFLQEREQMLLSDYCIAPSKFLADYVKEKYGLKNKIYIFPYPYFSKVRSRELIRDEVSKYYNISDYDDYFNIVLITRFEHRKCQDRLLNAFSKLIKIQKKLNLFLIGNSCINGKGIDYRNYLVEKYMDLPNCYFYDFMNLGEQEKYIAVADLCVMPSTYENQPVAMYETCLRGIPIIASKYSGIADYTEHKCMLFDPFDDNDLFDKIYHFYNMSHDEKIKIQKDQVTKLLELIAPINTVINRINLGR